MAGWTLDDIPWETFDASKVKPEMISIAKASSMVEHNGYDYARYLHDVFKDDLEFTPLIDQWAREEVQHGEALRKWAELADPTFDFDKSFKMFTDGYKLPQNVSGSIRGSRCGEMVARCIVETGTSAYYTALKEYAEEPVFKTICGKIAADELRHYKLFYDTLLKYIDRDKIGTFKRFRIALGRITESEDDELAYAYYAAHNADIIREQYDRKRCTKGYYGTVRDVYKRHHVERMTTMIFKAVGLKPHGWFSRAFSHIAWGALRWRLA